MMTPKHIDLAERASALYPDNPALQEKWIAAVAFLRSKGLWVLEGGPAKWGGGMKDMWWGTPIGGAQ